LAIDAGTGSCRAVLFDAAASQVAVASREWVHRETPGVPGGQDFDTERNWDLIAECISEVLRRHSISGSDVAAVSATSMREGIVIYDADGKEIWACPNVDSRGRTEAEELVHSGAAQRIYELAGDWVSITSPARLRWLGANHPDILERASSLGLLSDWILYRLSGEQVTEPSCGSSSGMFDLAKRAWSPEIAELCGLSASVLPPVYETGTRVGGVTPAAAAQTGLAVGTPVVTGGGDTQCGLAGAGIRPGEFTIVGGTFWQATALAERPVIDPQCRLRTLCHVNPGQWMIEGIGFYIGMSLRWMRDAFCDPEVAEANRRGIDPYVVMSEAAATMPPGSNGVVAIMSNVMNARRWVHASPSFLQFDLANPQGTGRAACIRAIQEAGAYVARAHRDILAEVVGIDASYAVFTGGAGKSRLWAQINADVLGVPVQVPTITESTARGAAIAAGVGAGVFSSLSDVPSLRAWSYTLEPDPDAVAVYEDAYHAWQDIYSRQLAISEDGLLCPLWRGAGADAES